MDKEWDELLAKVLSLQDKLLFEEAKQSFLAKAYRGAYILVWVSCAESIKRKFKEMSVRDGGASAIYGECQRKETNRQSVDHYLLEKARDYGLITATEFAKLEGIYDFRCVYGHPYETAPLPVNVLSAAADVVDIVLSKETRLRHGYLSAQLDNVFTKMVFLDDRPEAVERFGIEISHKCDESLHQWFLDKCWERAEPLSRDKSAELFYRRAIWFTRFYILNCAAAQRTDLVPHLLKWPNVVSQVFSIPETFRMLNQHSQEMVFGILATNITASPKWIERMNNLNVAGCLSKPLYDRFRLAIDSCKPADLAETSIDPNMFIHLIITELQSHDWYRQNPAVEIVANLKFEGIEKLTDENQVLLGNNILQSAEGGAREAINYIQSLASSRRTFPKLFVKGLLKECFVNSSGIIRFKHKQLASVFSCLVALPPADAKEIISDIQNAMAGGQPKPNLWPSQRDETVRIVRELMPNYATLENKLQQIITTLEQIEIADRFL